MSDTLACHRCGKTPAVQFVRMDIDLPRLDFCKDCYELGIGELHGWIQPIRKHVTREWYEAVKRKETP